MLDEFSKTLARLGIYPKDPKIYQTAFIHRSHLNETKVKQQSNERLEFLGDSVLSLVISSYLYLNRADDEEGDLTNLRAYIVKTDSLAKISQQLNLGKFLLLSKGEELSNGRQNLQILANTYEALLGAIYLDLGLDTASKFVELTLLSFFKEELEKGAPRDPKSQLQEVAQNLLQSAPKYKILSTSGPDHAKQFKVAVLLSGELVGQGEGSSKQQAEEEAAEKALEVINQNR